MTRALLARLTQLIVIAAPTFWGVAGAYWAQHALACTGPPIVPCGYVRLAFAGLALATGAVVSIALLAVADLTREVTPA